MVKCKSRHKYTFGKNEKEVRSMDIAALSMNLAQSQVLQSVGTAMLSNALDSMEVQGEAVSSMLEEMPSVNDVYSHIGGNIDIAL